MLPVARITRSQTKLASQMFPETFAKKRNVSKSNQDSGEAPPKKRAVFVDITNANNRLHNKDGKKVHSKKVNSSKLCEDMMVDEDPFSHRVSGGSSSYTTADESIDGICNESPLTSSSSEEDKLESGTHDIWPGVEDFDKENRSDPFSISEYAKDIFKYYKTREKNFRVPKYMEKQTQLTKTMRSILVNWLVELQDGFELNHESLYLSVKITDLYLSKKYVEKAKLQLVGATAVLISSKFDERSSPPIQDFLYVCDDAYSKNELLRMEIEMLKTLGFDLGIPLSYSFLRRYARCAKLPMEILTLARYILELSLTSYDLIDVLDSLVAAAALLVALKMKCMHWSPTLQFYSGYSETDLLETAQRLNKIVKNPKHGSIIVTKYSHRVFYHVAEMQVVDF